MSVNKIRSLNLPDDATVCISYSERYDVMHYTGEGESTALFNTDVKDFIIRVLKYAYDNQFGAWDWDPSDSDLNKISNACSIQAIETWKEMKEFEGEWPEHPEDADAEWADDPESEEFIEALAIYNDEVNALMENAWNDIMEEYQEYWLPLDISIEHYDHKRGCATVQSDIWMRASDYVTHGPFGEQSVSVETEMGTLSMAS